MPPVLPTGSTIIRLHALAAGERTPLNLALSPCQAGDALSAASTMRPSAASADSARRRAGLRALLGQRGQALAAHLSFPPASE